MRQSIPYNSPLDLFELEDQELIETAAELARETTSDVSIDFSTREIVVTK